MVGGRENREKLLHNFLSLLKMASRRFSSVVRVRAKMGCDVAGMVMVVVLQGVATHGHVGVEVGRADAARVG